MIPVEICINCLHRAQVRKDVQAAFVGGAARLELCGEMQHDGLTPEVELVAEARAAFGRAGLMVMIRPRQGDFCYTTAEVQGMAGQIRRAAAAGADGVVVGALHKDDNSLDREVLAGLVDQAKSQGLQVTLHRAFDATPEPLAALEQLVALKVDRVLTSGTPWSTGGGALQGIEPLRQTVEGAAGRIEVVVGGGVNPANAGDIVRQLPGRGQGLSLHAYSGVRAGGEVQIEQVKALVAAVSSN